MKNRTEENRRNLEMIAPTWTMLGLALTACGGGGGGGSSGFGGSPRTTPPTTTPRLSGVVETDPQFGVGGSLSATTGETNEIAQFYALRWDTAIAVLDIFGAVNLDVASKTVTLTATSSGSTTTASWTITGADAGDFIFVRDGAENAVLQTVHPVDYENPRDANRDNVYEITLDARGGTFGAAYDHILSTGDVDYTITITDDSADARPAMTPSPVNGIVDPHVQIYTGDRSATIIETNGIVQFYVVRWDTVLDAADAIEIPGLGGEINYEIQVAPKIVTLVTTTTHTASGVSSSSEVTWTIKGDDADDFIFVQDGMRNAVLQTVNRVDYENPRDANGDNVYEIELDMRGSLSGVGLENLAGDIDYTITVTDNPALDMI